eukprot:Hpha_TRINITY_DN16586_c0_g1::TRINITY_DN16586_c0_g1_i1::g.135649::m.135649
MGKDGEGDYPASPRSPLPRFLSDDVVQCLIDKAEATHIPDGALRDDLRCIVRVCREQRKTVSELRRKMKGRRLIIDESASMQSAGLGTEAPRPLLRMEEERRESLSRWIEAAGSLAGGKAGVEYGEGELRREGARRVATLQLRNEENAVKADASAARRRAVECLQEAHARLHALAPDSPREPREGASPARSRKAEEQAVDAINHARECANQTAAVRRTLDTSDEILQAEQETWLCRRAELLHLTACLECSLERTASALRPVEEKRQRNRTKEAISRQTDLVEEALAVAKRRLAEHQKTEARFLDAIFEERQVLRHYADPAVSAVATEVQSLQKLADMQESRARVELGPLADRFMRPLDPAQTFVGVYPDPCTTGETLTVYVVPRTEEGEAVAGVHIGEVEVTQLDIPHDHPPMRGRSLQPDRVPKGEGPGGGFAFRCAMQPVRPGRAGFCVNFRGQSFVATAQVSPALRVAQGASPPPPKLVAACEAQISERRLVMTVLGAPGQDLIKVAEFCGAASPATGALPAIQRIEGPVPMFRVAAPILFGDQHKYVGAAVSLPDGSGRSRATVSFPPEDGVDYQQSFRVTMSCHPASCREGERVTVVVTIRGPDLNVQRSSPSRCPVEVRGFGPIDELTQPVELGGGVYVGHFVPFIAANGFVGVRAFAESREVSRATVEVLPAEPASHVTLQVHPKRAPVGAVAHVLIITRDNEGRPTKGPEPRGLGELRCKGAASSPSAVQRIADSDSHYVASFIVAPGHKAVVELALPEGFEALSVVPSVAQDNTLLVVPGEAGAPGPPLGLRDNIELPSLQVSFAKNPLLSGDEVEVLVARTARLNEPEETPLTRNTRPPPPPPSMTLHGAEVLTPLVARSGVRGVWSARIKVTATRGWVQAVVTPARSGRSGHDDSAAGAPVLHPAEHAPLLLSRLIQELRGVLWRLYDVVRVYTWVEWDLQEREAAVEEMEKELHMRSQKLEQLRASKKAVSVGRPGS